MGEDRFRDFDAAEAERAADPPTFQLGGREWLVAYSGAAPFLALTRQIAAGGSNVLIGYDDYLRSTLREEDRAEFAAMLTERGISLRTLMDVVNWIVAEVTGSPFVEPASSQPARSKRGARPRVVSLDGGSTSAGSHSAAG